MPSLHSCIPPCSGQALQSAQGRAPPQGPQVRQQEPCHQERKVRSPRRVDVSNEMLCSSRPLVSLFLSSFVCVRHVLVRLLLSVLYRTFQLKPLAVEPSPVSIFTAEPWQEPKEAL